MVAGAVPCGGIQSAGVDRIGAEELDMSEREVTAEPPEGASREGVGLAFENFDSDGFWNDCEYSLGQYVEPSPSRELIASIEAELGFSLPASYIQFAELHNGGLVNRSCFPMSETTDAEEGYLQINGLYALGRTSTWSLCGRLGSTFMESEWGYPPIGVHIADTPTGGHDQIMLDYRHCSTDGEPQVVHVDQEHDFEITFVAKDFATFIHGLVSADRYDGSAEILAGALAAVESGSLSPIVIRALTAAGDRLPDGEKHLRALGRHIVEDKGFFYLHADDPSYLMFDVMFWLYSQLTTALSHGPEGTLNYDTPCFELMITTDFVNDPYDFNTRGFAKGFTIAWWKSRVASGAIVRDAAGYRLSATAEKDILVNFTSFT